MEASRGLYGAVSANHCALRQARCVRVDDPDATLEAIVKGSLATASSKNLRLYDGIFSACFRLVVGVHRGRHRSRTNVFGNLLCLGCSGRDTTLGHTDSILQGPLAPCFPARYAMFWLRTDSSRFADLYSCIDKALLCCTTDGRDEVFCVCLALLLNCDAPARHRLGGAPQACLGLRARTAAARRALVSGRQRARLYMASD